MRNLILWGSLVFLLAACFRDASTTRENPTSIPLNEFLNNTALPAEDTPTAQANVPSFTPKPSDAPSSTLPVGGPPIEFTSTPNSALPATRAIPSFTPRGSVFGDSGITPTAALSTQPVPAALITPTGFTETIRECVHVVQANQTLFSIATQLGVEVDAIIAFNPSLASNPNALQIGQELVVPNCTPTDATPSDLNPAATAIPPTTAPAAGSASTHTVQEGDTLFRIALQYGTTVDAIVAANPDLTSAESIIHPGQVLNIPAP